MQDFHVALYVAVRGQRGAPGALVRISCLPTHVVMTLNAQPTLNRGATAQPAAFDAGTRQSDPAFEVTRRASPPEAQVGAAAGPAGPASAGPAGCAASFSRLAPSDGGVFADAAVTPVADATSDRGRQNDVRQPPHNISIRARRARASGSVRVTSAEASLSRTFHIKSLGRRLAWRPPTQRISRCFQV